MPNPVRRSCLSGRCVRSGDHLGLHLVPGNLSREMGRVFQVPCGFWPGLYHRVQDPYYPAADGPSLDEIKRLLIALQTSGDYRAAEQRAEVGAQNALRRVVSVPERNRQQGWQGCRVTLQEYRAVLRFSRDFAGEVFGPGPRRIVSAYADLGAVTR